MQASATASVSAMRRLSGLGGAVYIFAYACSDQDERRVHAALRNAGILKSGVIEPHVRIMLLHNIKLSMLPLHVSHFKMPIYIVTVISANNIL